MSEKAFSLSTFLNVEKNTNFKNPGRFPYRLGHAELTLNQKLHIVFFVMGILQFLWFLFLVNFTRHMHFVFVITTFVAVLDLQVTICAPFEFGRHE